MANSKITISRLEKFSERDRSAIRSLVNQLGATFQELADNDLLEMIESKTTQLIVARDVENDQIVAMATLALYRIPYLKKAYLDDFIVSDEYQGQGVGSALMKAVVKQAEDYGAGYIEFTSNPKRVGANKFYQKQGFERRDTNVYRLNFNHAKTK